MNNLLIFLLSNDSRLFSLFYALSGFKWLLLSSYSRPKSFPHFNPSSSSFATVLDFKQEQSKASPMDNMQSPEVTSKSATSVEEVNDNTRNLTEKLSELQHKIEGLKSQN